MEGSAVSLSTITQPIEVPLTIPTLVKPHPFNDTSPAVPKVPNDHPTPTSSSNTADLGTFTPMIDLAPPLTSVPVPQSSPVNYSLPSVKGGAIGGVKRPSNEPLLNGSVLEHLTPASDPLNWKIEQPLGSPDVSPPPYKSSKVLARNTGYGTLSVGHREGVELSGASHGGVLLKHLPYLPVSSYSHAEVKPVEEGRDGGSGLSGVALGVGDTRNRNLTAVEGEEILELEQKIKVHAQTIDILVSERSSLQMEVSSLKTQLTNKSRECSDWESCLKTTQQKLSEMENEVLTTSTLLSERSKELNQLKSEKLEQGRLLDQLRTSLEDQREESTELISKVTAQSADIVKLQNANVELQSKINMAELLTQQLSGGMPVESPPTDPTLLKQLQEAEEQVKQLKRNLEIVTCDKDQVNSDLSALRDSMLYQLEDSTRKLGACQTQLAEEEAKTSSMKREMDDILVQKELLERKLSTEHAHSDEHSSQVAIETLKQEKEQLKQQLEQEIQENIKLVKMNTEIEARALEAELKLSRLEEQSVDHQNLLITMAQDKETLSRAMSQNKELKTNIAELQDAFVRLTHQNMELASQLDTERRRLSHVRAQMVTSTPITPPVSTPYMTPITHTKPLTSESDSTTTGTNGPSGRAAGNGPRDGVIARNDSDATGTSGSSGRAAGNGPRDSVVGRDSEFANSSDREMSDIIHPSAVEGQLTGSDVEGNDVEVKVEVEGYVGNSEVEVEEYVGNSEVEVEDCVGNSEVEVEDCVGNSEVEVEKFIRSSKVKENQQSEAESSSLKNQMYSQQAEGVVKSVTPILEPYKNHEITQEETDFSPVEGPTHHHAPHMSPHELDVLQSSFNALQQKFVILMKEKADLLEKIQEHEMVILKLASETDTIGDYIALYQTQRDALKDKFQQKDLFIQKLTAEKAAMQANIAQLQILIRKVISEQSHLPQHSTKSKLHTPSHSHPQPSSSHSPTAHSHIPQQPQIYTESTSIPIHLRPLSSRVAAKEKEETDFIDRENNSNYLSHMTEDESHVTTATVEQIMELLDQLEGEWSDGDNERTILVNCNFCTGELMTV